MILNEFLPVNRDSIMRITVIMLNSVSNSPPVLGEVLKSDSFLQEKRSIFVIRNC